MKYKRVIFVDCSRCMNGLYSSGDMAHGDYKKHLNKEYLVNEREWREVKPGYTIKIYDLFGEVVDNVLKWRLQESINELFEI